MSSRKQILAMLSDGCFCSGTEIGARLGISRAAVNKAVKLLVRDGICVHSVSGKGYRLSEPCRPLDQNEILHQLAVSGHDFTDRFHLLDDVDSTSSFLQAQSGNEMRSGAVCIAEAQRGGRGRRGRTWIATPYSNIMLSMVWRYDAGPAAVFGLSLAAGVALVDSLVEFGVSDAGLKWPNDVIWQGRKLAGLLLDVQGEATGPTRVVLGLGVNVRIGEDDAARIDQPWVDLRSILETDIDRNRLAAILVRHLEIMFSEFAAVGLDGFVDRWQQVHLYQGRAVRLLRGTEVLEGTVAGIDPTGALQLVNADGTVQSFHSGEVSLRIPG